MKNLKLSAGPVALFAFLLLSCDNGGPDADIEEYASVKAKEVVIDFVDINSRHLAKDGHDSFLVKAGNGMVVDNYLIGNGGDACLGFKPVLPSDSKGAEQIENISTVYMGDKAVAEVESTFMLDSVRSVRGQRVYYYTNTENHVAGLPVDSPVRMLVTADGAYREEGQAKFCITFNFPHVDIQPTEDVDYHVTINGFMGQSIAPAQRGLMVTEDPDGNNWPNVVLAVEGRVCNHYNAEGALQEPYDIVYELASRQLFGKDGKHILRVTTSGDCHSNKILACSFDGQRLDPASVVVRNLWGGEDIALTIEQTKE